MNPLESTSFHMHVSVMKLVFLCVTAVFTSACTGLLFHPEKQHVRTPTAIDLLYEDVYLESRDKTRIHGWFLSAQGQLQGSIYFLHGNAENISTHIASVHWLPHQGYQVFLLDYRGFGLSEGKPDLPEVLLDIEAGFKWLLEHAQGKPVFILGQSLGASLGIYFSATHPLAKEHLTGLVSDAAFTSYFQISKDIASKVWITWPLQYPLGWLMNYPYNPDEVIEKVSPIPILISHGTQDQIIPFEHGQQLYRVARQPKSFLATEGRHIETFTKLQNRQVLLDFMENAGELTLDK